jgi:hypothetical protein
MDAKELQAFYTLMQLAPGKNQQAKLNFLQDLGFKPFDNTVQQQFIQQPEPTYYNPMDVYGSDEKVAQAFALVQQGTDPAAAAKKAGLSDESLSGGANYPAIVAKYAEVFGQNKADYANWQAQQEYQKAKFNAEQASKPHPLTMQDLVGQSQYDVWSQAAGQPLTAENLYSQYKNMRTGAKAAQPSASTGVRMAPPTKSMSGNAKADQWLAEQGKKYLEMRLAASKQRNIPSEQGLQFLQGLMASNMSGK